MRAVPQVLHNIIPPKTNTTNILPTNNIPPIVQTRRGASPPKKIYPKTIYPIYATPVTYMG